MIAVKGRLIVGAAVVATGAALASPAAAQNTGLEFLGADAPRSVEMRGERDGSRTGELTVVVKNNAKASGELRLRYFPDGGDPIRLLGPNRAQSGLVFTTRPLRRLIRLREGKARGVHLRFHLAPDEALSRVNGFLQADLRDIERARTRSTPAVSPPPPARLRVQGSLPAVRFVPSEVSLQIKRIIPGVRWFANEEAEVTLRGDGVAALVDAPDPIGVTVLRKDGGSVRVELREPRIEGGVVRAKVKADPHEVGEYDGKLPVTPGSEDGPALDLDVDVGHAIGWAILAVFLGTLLGVLMWRAEDIRRRRWSLVLQLDAAVERYKDELDKSRTVAGFDISRRLGPLDDDEPFPDGTSVAGVRWSARKARDEDDFNAAAKDLQDIAARIQRWIVVERVAREARDLHERKMPARKDRGEFGSCRPHAEVRTLRATAQRDPKESRAAWDLTDRLAAHAALLGRCQELWKVLADGDKLPDDDPDRLYIEAHELEVIYAAAKAEGKDGDVEEMRMRVEEATEAVCQRVALALYGGAERPAEAADDRDPGWFVTGELLHERAADVPKPTTRPARSKINQLVERQGLRDWYWTLGRALVAVTAYTLTIYNIHWGTLVDYLTAFTTGFLTETIVSWAILPAFQSYRTRRKQKEPTTGEDVPDSDADEADDQPPLGELPVGEAGGNGARADDEPRAESGTILP